MQGADTAPRSVLVTRPAASGEVRIGITVRGAGPPVVMIPSLGRGAADFDDLAARLAEAGFQAAAVDPRGAGESAGPMSGVTLFDYADDVAAVVDALAAGPAVLVGHAFGNRVARATASTHPDKVSKLVLLAAGGQVAPAPEASKALMDVFDEQLPAEDHRAAVQAAFFAPGTAPDAWLGGWHPRVMLAQRGAGAATAPGAWVGAGAAPMFIVQAADDVIAPPGNSRALAASHPTRVTVATLPRAGHAMLPEQPAAIAELVIGYLKRG